MNNCRFFKLFFAVAVALFMAIPHEASAAGIFARSTPLDWSHRTQKKAPDVKTRNAVRKFSEKNGNKWTVRYNPQTGAPESLMRGKSSKRYPGRKSRDRSDLFLKENAEMLNIDVSSLKEAGETSFFGMNHLRYQQYYKGLPVEFSYTKVHMTEDGEVTGYQSSYNKDIDLDINPSVSAAQAIQTAGAVSGMSIRVSSHTLVVYPDFNTDTAYLAWKIRGRSFDGLHIWVYYVDAHSGKVLFSYDDMRRAGGYKKYTSKAKIYDISPVPSESYPFYQKPSTYWQNSNPQLILKKLSDQYIWIKDYTTRTVTDNEGTAYSTHSLIYDLNSKNWIHPNNPGSIEGKIFSAMKGPYFSVINFRGQSTHWDNGKSDMRSGNLADIYRIQSPVPYPNNVYLSWRSILEPLLGENHGKETFMAQYPVFNSPFEVGDMDDDGNITDEDEVFVEDNKGVRMGSYLGKRTISFLGPSIENPEFYVKLKSDSSGRHQGFTIYKSSYIVLTEYPENDGISNDIDWSTTTPASSGNIRFYVDTSLGSGGTFGIDEVNTFYHLNKMRRYFMQFNRIRTDVNTTHSRQPVNLDGHLDVMVHANGRADEMFNKIDLIEKRGMANAFYDLENNNIFIGDGIFDGINQDSDLFAYRSFALDGTIIRHEYTHYVVHQIYNIINFGEFGAISEALSDYFALASFWQEGEIENKADKKNLTKMGNFVTSEPRDLSLGDKKMTLNWKGELYNDSQILSQALYSLGKNGGTYYLGKLDNTGSTWSNLPVADLVIWGALFYFPDSFLNLYEAMDDVCGRINSAYPGKCNRDKISGAFMDHEMITGGSTANSDEYEAAAGGLCQNNNGPECAADITEKSEIQALIYPKGDLDYYTFTANSGVFTAELTLPDDGNYKFHGYMLTLYDSNRNQLMEAIPLLDSAITSDYCFSDEECRSVEQTVKLVYNIPKSGRYYLAVTAPQSTYAEGWGLSPEHSEKPYVLKTSFIQQGHVTAYVDRSTYASKFDNDIIKFDAPVIMAAATSKNIINESNDDRTIVAYDNDKYAAETSFSHVQLWDIQGNKLEQASSIYTPESGRMIAIIQCPNEPSSVPVVNSTGSIRGCFQIQQGFSRRYPAVGSVVVEVIGKNHMGAQVSIGKSKPVNLIAQSSKFEAYNNVLLKGEGEAVIRFAATGSGRLTIKAYTQTGTLVKVITDREVYAGEQGNETWDGTNDKGSRVASGVYFIKAEGPGLNKIEKVAVVR